MKMKTIITIFSLMISINAFAHDSIDDIFKDLKRENQEYIQEQRLRDIESDIYEIQQKEMQDELIENFDIISRAAGSE